jgi:predicted PolB exonuclease-like 3'-5' exonuclease
MQHKNLFIFDIETVVDLKAAANLLDLQNSDKEELRQALTNYHLEITDGKNSFPRQCFHQVVAISFVVCEIERDFSGGETYHLKEIRSGGNIDSSEEELVKGFFSHLKKNFSRLVSFNGKNFDLPVLKYAAMKHQVEAAWLYKSGDKWNNYNSKFSLDWHCDLADAFSDFGASSRCKMNEICAALNLPGKIGVDGSKVTEMFDAGKLKEIRDYCETDVINTYLLYLTLQQHNGSLSINSFLQAKEDLRRFLERNSSEKPHFAEFLKQWKE